jgi:hypothetical protein
MQRTTHRRARRTVLILAMLVAFALAAPERVFADQVSTPTAGEEGMYYDPANRFAVPIPTNWIAEEHDGYLRIVTSDDKISVTIAVIPGASATAAIETTMRVLDPDFDATPLPELMATPTSGSDDIALYTYDDGSSSGQLVQAFGRRVEGVVFVLILQGELESVKLRQVQVDKIQQGILINTAALGSPVATPAN